MKIVYSKKTDRITPNIGENDSEEYTASIFRVESKVERKKQRFW
jgi:hypothetical protein